MSQGPYIAVRSEIPGYPVLFFPGDNQARVLFSHGHLQVRVALVIAEHYVIPGLVRFDEVALENQGLYFVGSHDVIEIPNLGHHRPHLGQKLRRRLEIRAQPVSQGLGLAHVNDLPPLIFKEVHPGFLRHFTQPFLHFNTTMN